MSGPRPHFENYTETSERCTGVPELAGECRCGGTFACQGESHFGNSYYVLQCGECRAWFQYSTYEGGRLTDWPANVPRH